MHNKSFTADNQVAIVGGRNIGDEYFEAGTAVAFADLDTIVEGAVVRDVSAQFDAYWNSESAYPVASLVPEADASGVATVREAWSRLRASPEAAQYLDAVRETGLVEQLVAGTVELEWVSARLVSDDPDKVLHPPERREMQMGPRLQAAMGRPSAEMDLVSPYFVPTQEGTNALLAIAARGVKVRILTNSLAASDAKSVHAGYAKRREDLLRSGVQLYELKPTAAKASRESEARFGGSSSAALHAKTFAVDRNRIFVGSFNFDQRSALLNTEMGLVIESAVLAQRLAAFFDAELPMEAYEVRLTPDGRDLEWIEQTSSGPVRYDTDPGTSWFLRRGVDFLSILPIEWLL